MGLIIMILILIFILIYLIFNFLILICVCCQYNSILNLVRYAIGLIVAILLNN